MDARQMYYKTLSAYTEKFLWIGILFSILFIISVIFAFKNKEKQMLLKIIMACAMLWVAWVWLFITTWFHNLSLLREFPMVIWALVMEPLWTIVLTIVSGILFYDALKSKKIIFSIPSSNWDKIIVILFLVSSLVYPFYLYLCGFKYPNVMVVGIGPFPTFIFCGVLTAGSLPKANRWLVLLIMLAIWGSIPSLAGKLWENSILIPLFIYILYTLIKHWRKSKLYYLTKKPVSSWIQTKNQNKLN
jgi:hypothetical protein